MSNTNAKVSVVTLGRSDRTGRLALASQPLTAAAHETAVGERQLNTLQHGHEPCHRPFGGVTKKSINKSHA